MQFGHSVTARIVADSRAPPPERSQGLCYRSVAWWAAPAREQDGTEVTLFPVTIPHTDGDCIQVEVDPDEEIQQCVDRCNLWDLACP